MKMKRKMFSLFLALVMVLSCIPMPAMAVSEAPAASEPIESAFTDPAFLGAVREVVGKTNGEHIYPEDVEGITTLNVIYLDIESLQGIEYFTALKELYCYGNQMSEINLSCNTALEIFDCSYNMDLISIDVSACPELKTLECNYTGLERINVKNNGKLTRLLCYGTYLRTLNVSNNPQLERLDVSDACLTNLDVSNNDKLTYLDCSYNNMSSPDSVIGRDTCTSLVGDSFCYEPQNTDPVTDYFTDENFLGAVRDAIDKPTGEIYPSDLAEVTELTVNNSGLTNLDGIEYMTSLETLDCTSNYLEELDVYSNKQLKEVNCGDNYLAELDMSGNAGLQTLNAYSNELTHLDVSDNRALKRLNVSLNELKELDTSSCENLTELRCADNKIAAISSIKFPEHIASQLPSDVSTIKEPIVIGNMLLDYSICAEDEVNLEIDTNSFPYIKFSGKASSRTVVTVYEITTSKLDDIPEQYLRDKTLIKASEGDEQEDVIKKFQDRGSELASCTLPRKEINFGGTVDVSNNIKDFYKLVVVNTTTLGIVKSAYVVDVISTFPKVKSLILNNNSRTVIDLCKPNQPSITTYGSVSVKVVVENAADIEKLFINVSRPYVHPKYPVKNDRGHDIELTKTTDGSYQGILKLGAGEHEYEISDSNRLGKAEIKIQSKSDHKLHSLTSKPVKIVFDPSGYIYEGVPSNRLSDVKTTLYYKDRDGNSIEWDAIEYDQVNPSWTGSDGRYEWFVPDGLWRVKAEREGYETYYTDWMRVPPAQMDVNFGMVSKAKPVIEQLFAYPGAVEINLNKYVYEKDISTETVTVFADGQQVQGRISFVDLEIDHWDGQYNLEASGGTGNKYVSKLKFVPNTAFALGTNIKVCLNENIRSYAGVTAGIDCSKESLVRERPTDILIDDNSEVLGASGDNVVYLGETNTMKISVQPFSASRGKKLILTNRNPYSVSMPAEVLVDENGMAEIPMTGLMLGEFTITMSLAESNIEMEVDVVVGMR